MSQSSEKIEGFTPAKNETKSNQF